MAEYIERERARYELTLFFGYDTDVAEDCDSLLCMLPAADVAPVVHGRWDRVINPQWKAYSHDKCNLCGWWNTRNALCYDGKRKDGDS